MEEWRALPHDEKRRYYKKSAHRRSITQAQPAPMQTFLEEMAEQEKEPLGGPCNISTVNGVFSVDPAIVEEAYAPLQLQASAPSWNAKFNPIVHAHAAFPETVPADGPSHVIPIELAGVVKDMLDTLRLFLLHSDMPKSILGRLIELKSGNTVVYGCFANCMHLKRGDFQADVFHMQACGDLASGLELGPADGGEHLATVMYCKDIGPDKSDVAKIQTETEFIEHLARMSKVLWDMIQRASPQACPAGSFCAGQKLSVLSSK